MPDKYKVPESARNNAKKVLEWKDKHGDDVKGMTQTGWARANQLANNSEIGLDTIKRMASFNRHRSNYEKGRARQKAEGKNPWEIASIVAWLGWGGTSGIDWAIKISSRNKEAKENNSMEEELEGVVEKDNSDPKSTLLEKAHKRYGDYDDYEGYYKYHLTPDGVISFDELKQHKTVMELKAAYELALGEFIEMADRIMSMGGLENRPQLLKQLIGQLMDRIESMSNEAESVGGIKEKKDNLEKAAPSDITIGDIVRWRFPGDAGTAIVEEVTKEGSVHDPETDRDYEATRTNPVYKVALLNRNDEGKYVRTQEKKYKTADQLEVVTSEVELKKEKVVTEEIVEEELTNVANITKERNFGLIRKDGSLYWYGVPTNKYQDSDKEIIASSAHEKFAEKLNSGQEKMPDLFIWHIEKAIGDTQYVDYDERGFLVAGGTIFKEYEGIVQNIVENMEKDGEPLGMSHGMDPKKVKVEGKTFIEYVSTEFSLLPLAHAANLLTGFAAK